MGLPARNTGILVSPFAGARISPPSTFRHDLPAPPDSLPPDLELKGQSDAPQTSPLVFMVLMLEHPMSTRPVGGGVAKTGLCDRLDRTPWPPLPTTALVRIWARVSNCGKAALAWPAEPQLFPDLGGYQCWLPKGTDRQRKHGTLFEF